MDTKEQHAVKGSQHFHKSAKMSKCCLGSHPPSMMANNISGFWNMHKQGLADYRPKNISTTLLNNLYGWLLNA